MFQSSGYFRGVNCPFYASGLCERPYCHFRHSRVEERKTESTGYTTCITRPYQHNIQNVSSGSSYAQTQSNCYGHTEIASYSTSSASEPTGPVEAYKTSNSSSDNGTFPIPSFTEQSLLLPESNEEPVKFDSLPKISGLPKPKQTKARRPSQPSYIPTPITRTHLTVEASAPTYKPTPKHSLDGSKRSSITNTTEYDPVKNYAFREKLETYDKEEQFHSEENSDVNVSQTQRTNGIELQHGKKTEGIFSDDENDKNAEKNVRKGADNDLTDSDEDVSARYIETSSSVQKHIPSYAELLTPSSYFTSKLSSLSSDSNTSLANGSRKLSTDSQKSCHSAISSKSATSDEKSRSTSDIKSSSAKKKSPACEASAKSDLKPSTSSSRIKSSHKDHRSSSGGSSSKPSSYSSSHAKREGSSASEKENRQSLNKSSTSLSFSSKSHSSIKKEKDNTTHHKEDALANAECKSPSCKEKSGTTSDKHKCVKDSMKAPKSSHKSASVTIVKSEKKSTSDKKKHSSKNYHSSNNTSSEKRTHSSKRSHSGSNKDFSSNKSKDVKIKQEYMESGKKERKGERKCTQRNSTKKPNSVTKHSISSLTSNLFGEESDADSDVQIVDPPPESPVPVVELSDSEREYNEDDTSFSCPTDDVDLLSDSDTFDECLRIFQESERQLAAKSQKQNFNHNQAKMETEPKAAEPAENLLISLGKKRMAHKVSNQISRPMKTLVVPRPKLSPAEVMHNRIVEMQKRALLRAAEREGRESELPQSLSDKRLSLLAQTSSLQARPKVSASSLSAAAVSLDAIQKKREAHTPALKTPTKAQPATPSNSSWSPNSFYGKNVPSRAEPAKIVTIASTASKAEKRKAHEPTVSNLQRPLIPVEFGSKVPTNIRQRYLNLIIDEYLKFNPEKTSFTKGLEEEQAVYTKSSNKNIYLRVAVNAIKRIRTEAMESQPSSSKKLCSGLASLSALAQSTSAPTPQSHAATLGGSWAAKTSYTLHRSGPRAHSEPQSFQGKDFYNRLKKYILTEEQLQVNGFPRPSEDGSSKAKIYKEEERDKMLKDNERTCKRCGKRFYVEKDGSAVTNEQCVYHYANAYRKKVDGSFDSRYGCCNERTGSNGCQVAKCHVHERNKSDNLTGYMRILPASLSSEKNFAVYSLDCEMVYTKAGLELARVTVIGDDDSVKYESLVKPDAEIVDYNTRFSGITEADIKGVTVTLRGVQAVLLSMFSDQTILIGHSLESDFQSLKLIHNTVVDTSIVFPHRLGLPYKRALRNLMVDYLQKIIQIDDGGHDSKEDAVACMQLMQFKVKEDAKREVRRI